MLQSCHHRLSLGSLLSAAALGLGHLPSSLAQGGPPMLTDDPGTPGAGAWEINIAYAQQRTREEKLHSVPFADFNYGLGETIQLKYEVAWLISELPESGGTRSGLDNSLFGVKWRFLDEERNGLDMSVYPQLELENPTGSVSRGIVEPGPNLFLPVEAAHDFGKFKLVGEVGYQIFHSTDNEWVVGVLGATHISESLEVMAEVRSFSQKLLNDGDVVANVGMRQELNQKVKLVASIGTGLTNHPDSTTFLTYVGVQIVLGEK
ncbi:MAG TPA: hypothetical protein VN496_03890 [Burkholderiales bacterium]|nr:hypothetical protein [Burkholderiales bacterium]